MIPLRTTLLAIGLAGIQELAEGRRALAFLLGDPERRLVVTSWSRIQSRRQATTQASERWQSSGEGETSQGQCSAPRLST